MKIEVGPKAQTSHGKKDVVFMEVKDYKMEIDDPTQTAEQEIVKKEQHTEQEKREAFKKKLRKYSGKIPQAPAKLP